MTETQMKKLAYDIACSTECSQCVAKCRDCDEYDNSNPKSCTDIWYEHIQNIIKEDEIQQHIKY